MTSNKRANNGAATIDRPKTRQFFRRDEILAVLIAYAREHGGNSPSVRGLWIEFKRRKKAKMAYGVFLRHIERLEAEGKIARRDGVIVVSGAGWRAPGEK
jgi:hypothetical protein